MSICWRNSIKKFLKVFFLSTFLFGSLFPILYIKKFIKYFDTALLPIVKLQLVEFIPVLFSVSCLIASYQTIYSQKQNLEILTLQTSGFSNTAIIKPILYIASFISIITCSLFFYLLHSPTNNPPLSLPENKITLNDTTYLLLNDQYKTLVAFDHTLTNVHTISYVPDLVQSSSKQISVDLTNNELIKHCNKIVQRHSLINILFLSTLPLFSTLIGINLAYRKSHV